MIAIRTIALFVFGGWEVYDDKAKIKLLVMSEKEDTVAKAGSAANRLGVESFIEKGRENV